MSKIALAIIVKDDSEATILRRCLDSVAPYVDGIFITGTKEPQKEIKKICKEYKAVWSWFEWCKDFSKARNYNWSQVPKEYDWIFWCDTDDVIVGAETFKEAIALAEKNNIKAVFARYLYQVELNPDGSLKNILIEHLRERLIRNDDSYKWVAPIHETLIEQVPTGKTDFQGFYVIHLAKQEDMENSMWRNIEILEQEVIDNPQDPRPIYYLAKAYYDTHCPELLMDSVGEGLESVTIELVRDYLRKSGWAEERAQAWEYLSMIYRENNEYKKAISCLLEAFTEDPKFPSIYIQLALCYTTTKDWSKALHWVKLAGNVEIPKTTLVINPRDYKTMILECLFHIYLNTGQLDNCVKVTEELVNLLPTSTNMERFNSITDVKQRNDIAHYVVKLAMHLKTTNQPEQLKALINSIPKEIAAEPALINLRNEYLPPTDWGDDEIMIYCGGGWEKWSPKSVAKGIGGSEEAVIYLSKELVKLGWKVTVYADPQDDAGEYDGVKYKPYYEVNWNDKFNVVVAWRQIGVADINFKCKKLYLWNHDIQNAMTYTIDKINKFTKFMFLSKWHRDNVPALPEEKVMITANGINI
jgi:tetratricopeptide (TPR) repeat protein